MITYFLFGSTHTSVLCIVLCITEMEPNVDDLLNTVYRYYFITINNRNKNFKKFNSSKYP